MTIIILSIAGLPFCALFNYFFLIGDTPRIGKIILGILSLIPFIGAVAYFIITIIGIFNHCHLYEYANNGDKFPVRDTKLNRWLFDDIDWEKYDTIQKSNAKYNDSKE